MIEDNEDNFKKCNACKKNIKKDASKCHHCGTSQTIMAKFSSYSLVLSVVATLLSLIAISAPVLNEFFVEKKPDLKGVMLEGSGDTVKFSIFNGGRAPAIIKGVHLSYTTDEGSLMTHFLKGENIDRIIEPGETLYFVAKTRDGQHLPLQTYPGMKSVMENVLQGKCSLKIVHHDFTDEELIMNIKYRCLAGHA